MYLQLHDGPELSAMNFKTWWKVKVEDFFKPQSKPTTVTQQTPEGNTVTVTVPGTGPSSAEQVVYNMLHPGEIGRQKQQQQQPQQPRINPLIVLAGAGILAYLILK